MSKIEKAIEILNNIHCRTKELGQINQVINLLSSLEIYQNDINDLISQIEYAIEILKLNKKPSNKDEIQLTCFEAFLEQLIKIRGEDD